MAGNSVDFLDDVAFSGMDKDGRLLGRGVSRIAGQPSDAPELFRSADDGGQAAGVSDPGGQEVGVLPASADPGLGDSSEATNSKELGSGLEGAVWDRMHIWRRIDAKAKTFMLSKASVGPPMEAIYARTTVNLDDGTFFEDRQVIENKTVEELCGPLPFKGRKKHCRL